MWFAHLASAAALIGQQKRAGSPDSPNDWICPMDPDVHAAKAGLCPRCGMKLVLHVPDRIEYPLEVTLSPAALRPGEAATLTLRVLNPGSNRAVRRFEIVHEKLMHLFLVSENLEYFLHDHPVPRKDGSFQLKVKLPYGGMYRLLADFYPAGSVPQLAVGTLFVAGDSEPAKLSPSLAPARSANMTAALRLEPEQPLAGLETKLFFTLDPSDGLEKYLGAWGHMLTASADLIDLLHSHPFLITGSVVQFNVIFPREGLYRVWTQFQRRGVVNTVVFTIPVKSL
ncbi:MAG TPA: heavy metal-binding domain-containing protein [Bryobacteraceae bacterium]|nr:heavy metal-binding domain-containing protein [Bryobacteraceae bacterium]